MESTTGQVPLLIPVSGSVWKRAWKVGVARQQKKEARGRRSRLYGLGLTDTQAHVRGVLGELQVGAYLGVKADLSYREGSDTKRPDLRFRGWRVSVKLRGPLDHYEDKRFYLDPRDMNDDIVVWGEWDWGPVVKWWGWLWMDEFDAYAVELDTTTRGTRYVGPEVLRDMDSLLFVDPKEDVA